MDARTFLLDHLTREAATFWGEHDAAYLGRVADDWLDASDSIFAKYRLGRIRMLHPGARRILDMGAGCGTFVRHALRQGYDVCGIEPESWKREVARRGMGECGEDPAWTQRIISAVGERLPFADRAFDCVTTFQTLEHVQDVASCCAEMVRVTRPGGWVYVRCPDYALSTYEGHYRLPWPPGLWGKAAERYLALLGKPVAGLRSLQPVSARMLRRIFVKIGNDTGVRLRIVDLDDLRVRTMLRLPAGGFGYLLSRPVFFAHFVRLLFRVDYSVHTGVMVVEE